MRHTMNNDDVLCKNVILQSDLNQSAGVNPRMLSGTAGSCASDDGFRRGSPFSRWEVTVNASGKPIGKFPVAWASARAFRNHPSPKRKRGIFCPHPPGEPGGVNSRMLCLTHIDYRLKTRRTKSPEIES